MKTLRNFFLLACILLASTVQLIAQVNGTAARPVVSTQESPVYFYVESAWDGTPSLNNISQDVRGHLVYTQSNSPARLRHNLLGNILSTRSVDDAIWQLINEDGIVKMKNKATGLYFAVSRETAATVATNLRLLPIAGTSQYNLVNDPAGSGMVAWTNTTCDRLSSNFFGANGAAAFYFIVVPGSEDNYAIFYMESIKAELASVITRAQAMLDISQGGGEFGQYPMAARTALSDLIAAAEAVAADTDATESELVAQTTAVNDGLAVYISTVNDDPVLLTDATHYRWYWIRSTSTHVYAADKVFSSVGRDVGLKYTFEAKAAEPIDEQLFRFELTEDKSAVQNIVCKTGTFMSTNGTIVADPLEEPTFSLIVLNDGISYNIKPSTASALHAQEAGANIVNWAGVAGSASAWVFDLAMQEPKVLTSVQKTETGYRILVNNGVITVEGVDAYEVYSLTGQRQPHNVTLQKGVYIVKSQEFTVKIAL
jgi:hypothetical protein